VSSFADRETELRASSQQHNHSTNHYSPPALTLLALASCAPADPGQTYNSSETLKRLIASDPQLLILLGDFAYADEWVNATQRKASKSDGTCEWCCRCDLCTWCLHALSNMTSSVIKRRGGECWPTAAYLLCVLPGTPDV
jgi:hypothetical protein